MKVLKKRIGCCILILCSILFVLCGINIYVKAEYNGNDNVMELYSVTGVNSSIEYGSHSVYSTEKKGIKVKLAPRELFRYNKIIDLRDKTSLDTLISLFVTPSIVGTSNAHFLSITLTDAYDENNKVTATCWDPWQDKWGQDHFYFYAYANDQIAAGKSALDGKIQKNNCFGTEGLASFSGVEAGGAEIGSREIILSFDYNEKQIFGTKYTIDHPLIADFDDTDFFDVPWDGFTTGEVFLSIEAGNFNASTFDFVITNIDNQDITKTSFKPDKNPMINVDTSMFNGEIETYVNRPFNILPYSSYSVYDKNLKNNVSVLLNGEKIEIESNSFIPKTCGDYYIVYDVLDNYGNSVKKEIKVVAKEFDGLNMVIFDRQDEFVVGEPSYLAKQIKFDGEIIGDLKVNIEICLVGKNIVEKIDYEKLQFTPKYVGEYVVRFEYSDYVNFGTLLYKIVVKDTDDVYLYNLPELPNYFIYGAKYSLPEHYGYVSVDGVLKPIKADIYISQDGSEEQLCDGLYKVRALNKVKVYYKVKNGLKNSELFKEIPVVDVGYGDELHCEKYFINNDNISDCIALEDSISFNVLDGAKSEFINIIQAENFYLSFSAILNNLNKQQGKINFILTDAERDDVSIKFSFINTGNITKFTINDNNIFYNLPGSLSGNNRFNLEYKNKTQTVKLSSSLSIRISNTILGNSFNGFSSSLIKFAFEVENVDQSSSIYLYKLNNQQMCDLTLNGDIIEPEFIINPMRGDRAINDEITIRPVIVSDVLDPYIECTITVLSPDGNYVVDKNGIILENIHDCKSEFVYVLAEYGNYVTTYEVKDGALNRIRYSFQNIVIDQVAPRIEIIGEASGKLNENIIIPNAVAYDDMDGELTTYIYIETPNGTVCDVSNNKTIKATISGKYCITFYAVDKAGNIEVENILVEVN